MKKSLLIGVVAAVCILVLIIVFSNAPSTSKQTIDLHELPPHQAAAKVSAAQAQITKYHVVTNYKATISLSFLGALLSFDIRALFDTNADKAKHELVSEGDMDITTSFDTSQVSGALYSDEETQITLDSNAPRSMTNRTHYKITVKGNIQTTEIDGVVQKTKVGENATIWQDPFEIVDYALTNERFVLLKDEKIDGVDCYVFALNISSAHGESLENFMILPDESSQESQASSGTYDIKTPLNVTIWIEKDSLLMKRILMELNATQQGQGITLWMDSKITYPS